jgi:threonine/homoserine/homoserine lactone efflux protein
MNGIYPLLAGLALGFSLTIPPGPMNALIARRTMRSLRAGITTGLGAMSADAILGAIVYGVRATVDLGARVHWIEGIGAVVLAVLVVRLLGEPSPAEGPAAPDAHLFTEALIVGVTNPFQILWWVTAGLAFAYVGGAPLFIGLFGAIAVWVVVFPYVLREGARRDPRVPRIVSLVSAAMLAAFSVFFLVSAFGFTV